MREHKIIFLALLPIIALFLLGTLKLGNDKSSEYDEKERGWLGVSLKELDHDTLNALGLDEQKGVMVAKVHPKSPADKAGLKEEDIITEFNGRKVKDSEDLVRFVRRTKPGELAKMKILRRGQERELEVKIGSIPDLLKSAIKTVPVFPQFWTQISKRGTLGLYIQDLNKQLGEYFGVTDGKGVLILDIKEDSAAEKAGFLPGDVILKIEGKKIDDSEELIDELKEFKEGEKISFEILRKQKKQVVTAEIESLLKSHSLPYGIYNRKGVKIIYPHKILINIPEVDVEVLGEVLEDFDIDVDVDLKEQEKAMKNLEKELEGLMRCLNRTINLRLKKDERQIRHLDYYIKYDLKRRIRELNKRIKEINSKTTKIVINSI